MKLVKELKVDKAVRFVGFVDYDKIPEYLNASDIFVSVPSSDSTSNSLLEAMACGVAPIVSDFPTSREIIKDGWSGYIVPQRNSEALAKAIVKLIKNPKMRKSFGARCRKFVEENAHHYKEMKRMEELYMSFIKR
ncbi:N-acetyl-alpha-D-glucosaminyl L-malate synthase [subsurface metagenome]